MRKNKINQIKDLYSLNSLKKLYLSNNNITTIEGIQELPSLTELTVENNPIKKQLKILEKNSLNCNSQICKKFTMQQVEEIQVKKDPTTPILNKQDKSMVSNTDKRSPTRGTEQQASQQKTSNNNVQSSLTKPKIESNVIKIIQREWEKEIKRLDAKKNGIKPKQNLGDKSLVQSGHAEIEANKILYIFGNALEVLQRSEFYDQVEEMHMQYVRLDLIVYHANLEKLKKFTKLKKLILLNNYLNSSILLSKIECLHSLQNLVIFDNEILQSKTLKSFVVYRFQHIQEFNGVMINDFDKIVAKQQFQLFDKILSIQNIFTKKTYDTMDPTKRQEQRLKSKKNLELAHIYVMGMIDECTKREESKSEIESRLENAVRLIIVNTTMEGMGEPYQMQRKLQEGISRSGTMKV